VCAAAVLGCCPLLLVLKTFCSSCSFDLSLHGQQTATGAELRTHCWLSEFSRTWSLCDGTVVRFTHRAASAVLV
jgi:hypothetical protein